KRITHPVSGGNGGGETPVPIPNTAVKPSCADGTARSPCGRVGRRRIFLAGARLTRLRGAGPPRFPGPCQARFIGKRREVGGDIADCGTPSEQSLSAGSKLRIVSGRKASIDRPVAVEQAFPGVDVSIVYALHG